MIKNNLSSIIITLFSVLLMSCSGNDQFKIEKGKVGHVTQKTTVLELDNIFKNDSIVKNLSEGSTGDDYLQDDDKYLIYDKEGKHLLTIIPKEQLDSTSTIKSVQIHDARFKTETGITLDSNFLDIKANSNIDKVESSFSSATLFIDELNTTIAIDKEELGLKSFSTQKVVLDQIPDLAKIKSFIVWFN